ncbi:unnamed protein product [Arabidopsis halleri]
MDMAKGSPMGSYGILLTYLHMLTRANIGTITDLQTEEDGYGDSRFKYCFVALGASVYPIASHGACIVHLQRNVAAKFKKRILATLISKAARAFRKSTFNEYFEEIERVSPGCAEYLMAIVLKEARELPIVSTLEYIRGTLMTWFEKRRGKAAQHKMDLAPKVEEIVQRNYERSTCYEVIKINNEHYEIKTTTGLSYVVDIQNKTCTCAEFNMLKIPYSHAIAAAVRCDLKVPLLAAPQYGTFF